MAGGKSDQIASLEQKIKTDWLKAEQMEKERKTKFTAKKTNVGTTHC